MGAADLQSIASHEKVEVVGLCDVDSKALDEAAKLYPEASKYSDYRTMLLEMADEIDAVIVSTPDHTHAPASMMAMEDADTVYEYSTRLIRKLGPEGFILHSGCDIPDNAKLENVQAMVSAAL